MIVNRLPLASEAKLAQVITRILTSRTEYVTGTETDKDYLALAKTSSATDYDFNIYCDVDATSKTLIYYKNNVCYSYNISAETSYYLTTDKGQVAGGYTRKFQTNTSEGSVTYDFILAGDASHTESGLRQAVIHWYTSITAANTTTSAKAYKYLYPESSGLTTEYFSSGTTVRKIGTYGSYTLVRTGSSGSYAYNWVLSSKLN